MNNLATTVQNMTEYTIPVGGVNLRNLWTSFHSKCRVLAYVHKTTLLCSLKKNYVPTTIAARTHTHTHTHTCARTHTHHIHTHLQGDKLLSHEEIVAHKAFNNICVQVYI